MLTLIALGAIAALLAVGVAAIFLVRRLGAKQEERLQELVDLNQDEVDRCLEELQESNSRAMMRPRSPCDDRGSVPTGTTETDRGTDWLRSH